MTSTSNINKPLKPINPKAKYRPALTTMQILTILDLARTAPITEDKMSVISTLAPILAKIQVGAIAPAYVTHQGKRSIAKTPEQLLEELGGSLQDLPLDLSDPHYWAKCYDKHCAFPATCTKEEVAAAQEHMYLNDLMSEEEIQKFEANQAAASEKLGEQSNEIT